MIERRGPWSVASRREVYGNRWIEVVHHEVVTPSGTPGIYGTVHYKNLALGVLPIDREGNTYLVGQYRFALREYSWEIPEGGADEERAVQQAAARPRRRLRQLQRRLGYVDAEGGDALRCGMRMPHRSEANRGAAGGSGSTPSISRETLLHLPFDPVATEALGMTKQRFGAREERIGLFAGTFRAKTHAKRKHRVRPPIQSDFLIFYHSCSQLGACFNRFRQ